MKANRAPRAALLTIAASLAALGCQRSGGAVQRVCEEEVAPGTPAAAHVQDIALPEQSDWVDHGLILAAGAAGAWDRYLYGGFAGSVVKKDSVFLLYYQGARDYSERYGTVTYRAVGVATSRDGVHFTKHPRNPVIAWFPNDGLEEGAVSSGATLDETGEVVLYYGANTKVNDWLVSADGRLAVSHGGLDFRDAGVVLDHRDRARWGSGDEMFPIIGFRHRGQWYVYYIPNGTPQGGRLGVAWGPDRDRLPCSDAATARGRAVEAWGMGGYARIGSGTYALFLSNVRKSHLEVRTVNPDAPSQLSAPVRTYASDDFAQGTVFLDEEAGSWYLFYRRPDEGYHVKTAPVVRLRPSAADTL